MQQLTEAVDELRKTNENVATLLEKIQQRGVTQTVVHKSNMGGFVAGIAVAACICSMFVTMFIARSVTNELRDMKAWQDVLRGKVATIEGKITQQEKRP